MSTPKISVIVPVYNVEKYIAECLESLINQTLHDIEIVCVDDCSTDGSVDIVRKYAATDPRIRLLTKAKNSGLSETRNVGIANSSAPYMMFCDSDDFFAPDMCEKMLNAVTVNNADLAICGTRVIYEADEHLRQTDEVYFKVSKSGVIPISDAVVSTYNVSTWNKIYKSDIIKQHNILFPMGLKFEDEYFWRVYCLWAKNIACIPEHLYNYRRRPGSIMNNVFNSNMTYACDPVKITIKYFEYLQNNNLCKPKHSFFWKDFFIPLYEIARQRAINDAEQEQVHHLAADFIGSNYVRHNLDSHTHRIICMISRGDASFKLRYLFGLIRITEAVMDKKIKICGLPIYKIIYTGAKTKHYVCNVRFF